MTKYFYILKTNIILLFALLSSATLIADTHNIYSGSYYYSPSSLTINVGDTVNWYNDGGFHNVNANINQ